MNHMIGGERVTAFSEWMNQMMTLVFRWTPTLAYGCLILVFGIRIFEDDGLIPRVALPICVYLFICSLTS